MAAAVPFCNLCRDRLDGVGLVDHQPSTLDCQSHPAFGQDVAFIMGYCGLGMTAARQSPLPDCKLAHSRMHVAGDEAWSGRPLLSRADRTPGRVFGETWRDPIRSGIRSLFEIKPVTFPASHWSSHLPTAGSLSRSCRQRLRSTMMWNFGPVSRLAGASYLKMKIGGLPPLLLCVFQ